MNKLELKNNLNDLLEKTNDLGRSLWPRNQEKSLRRIKK